jgi:pyruvate dehydrogenase E1 component
MDEPESIAALTLAARERLDNCIFVVNCNLQRLDGPVRGNGRIVDELEALFAGAGWNVSSCLWGSDWDALLARDPDREPARAFAQTVDGEFQTLRANDGAFNREQLLQQDAELQALVAHLTDERHRPIAARRSRPGEDVTRRIARAVRSHGPADRDPGQDHEGLRHGHTGQGRMTTHQQKKLDAEELLDFRDRFAAAADRRPGREAWSSSSRPRAAPEMRYLHAHRAALGGQLPQRRRSAPSRCRCRALDGWARSR